MGRGQARSGRKSGGRSYSSSKSTGLRTARGAKVRNAAAYAATGAKSYTAAGKAARAPAKYAKAVQGNSMKAAARKAARAGGGGGGAFTYTASLPGGKKYVGMTAKPEARIAAHHSGKGASATRNSAPLSVTFHAHASKKAAKTAETRLYFAEKAAHGGDKVRGAGNTKQFSAE